MINFDVTKANIKKHNSHQPQIPDHPCKILIIGSSGSRKINALFNLIKQQDDDDYIVIDNIQLYVTYMLRIQMKQNINILLINLKKMVLKDFH